jgi:hypothetical protein
MNELELRRLSGLGKVIALSICFYLGLNYLHIHLYDSVRISGFVLLLLVISLSAFNARKRVPFLPMGTVSFWLQAHVYVGLFCVFVFICHAGLQVPRGFMEILLWLLFWIVSLSGIFGLILSRQLPRRLNRRGSISATYEQIPQIRRDLAARAQAIALSAPEKTKMTTVADFYVYKLARFFQKSNNFWSHVFGLSHHMSKIWGNINSVKRYLDAEELKLLEQLERLVYEKDELDYQYALQRVLKLWLFIHIPITVALLVFGIVHSVLAWVLSGS